MTALVPFLVVLARTIPLVEFTPFLGASQVPWTLRLAYAGGLAALLAPLVPVDAVPGSLAAGVSILVAEACIGLALGFLGSLVFESAQMAGALVDRAATGRSGHGPFERTYAMLSVVVFLTVGGHHLWLDAIAGSYTAFPVGGLTSLDATTVLAVGRAAASAVALAVLFALPGLVTAVVVESLIAVTGRSATRLGPFFSAIPTRALAVLGVSLLGLGVFAQAFTSAALDAMTALGAF